MAAEPIIFELTRPSTWIPSVLAGGLGVYVIARRFKQDSRDDKQVKQVDGAMQQVIDTLRAEITRLSKRVTDMEEEIVRLHVERKAWIKERETERSAWADERQQLMTQLADCTALKR